MTASDKIKGFESDLAAYAKNEPRMTEYERAWEEARITSLYRHDVPVPSKVKYYGQAYWARHAFARASKALGLAAEDRSRLYTALEGAGGAHLVPFLWKRMDEDMTRATAALIIRAARSRMHSEKLSLKSAVTEEIAIYDSRPVERHVRAGKTVRSGAPKRVASEEEAPPPDPLASDRPAGDTPAAFLAKMRFQALEYVKAQAPLLDDATRARLVNEFHVDLNELVRGFSNRVKSASSYSEAAVTPIFARSAMVKACSQLSMPAPKPGDPVDMIKARRLFRQQARDHHPDRTDDTQRHALYRKLAEACQTLSLYNDSLK